MTRLVGLTVGFSDFFGFSRGLATAAEGVLGLIFIDLVADVTAGVAFGVSFLGTRCDKATSAVTGRDISGRFGALIGRIGADNKVPTLAEETCLDAVAIAVVGLAGVGGGLVFVGTVSTDAGRSGNLPASLARFCAWMVSLMEGLAVAEPVVVEAVPILLPVEVLPENPRFSGLGFAASEMSRCCCFFSIALSILYDFSDTIQA